MDDGHVAAPGGARTMTTDAGAHNDDDTAARRDEAAALEAIYGDDVAVADAATTISSVTLWTPNRAHPRATRIEAHLPAGYPSREPPLFVFHCPHAAVAADGEAVMDRARAALDATWSRGVAGGEKREGEGAPCLFEAFESIRGDAALQPPDDDGNEGGGGRSEDDSRTVGAATDDLRRADAGADVSTSAGSVLVVRAPWGIMRLPAGTPAEREASERVACVGAATVEGPVSTVKKSRFQARVVRAD